MAVFVATVLISTICGTPVGAGLLGACLGTLIYQVITGFKSPVFISNSGATVSAVLGALILSAVAKVTALGVDASGYQTIGGIVYAYDSLGNVITSTPVNYFAVFVGGLVILAVYGIFALIIKLRGIDAINKLFPPYIVGPITIVIGLNLAGFIPTYVGIGQGDANIGVLVAISVMLCVALTSHYFKGFLKTIPFLIGLFFGFVMCLVLELLIPDLAFGVSADGSPITILEQLKQVDGFFTIPDFTFLHWADGFNSFGLDILLNVILLFAPVAICALCEHYSDHAVMSNIIGHDLTKDPGLDKTLLGDGVASVVGTIFGGQPNTSYGESTAMVGFSRVASVKVVSLAAVMMGILAFIEPVQVFINAIPSCVFGGCAMILYGYIACSGLKTLMRNKVDLENNKNLVVVSVILTVGVSGIWLFSNSFAGVSLAMVLGILLNLLLKDHKKEQLPSDFESNQPQN